jgi:hypothetical protein
MRVFIYPPQCALEGAAGRIFTYPTPMRPHGPKILTILPKQPSEGGRRSEEVENSLGIFKLYLFVSADDSHHNGLKSVNDYSDVNTGAICE